MRRSQFVILFAMLACGQGCHEPGDKAAAATLQNITPGVAFLKDCKKWDERFFGKMQGLDARRRDSASNLCFCAYYQPAAPYEIVFVYKSSVGQRSQGRDESIFNDFTHDCDRLFADFDCYAFVHPMQDPNKMEDMHEDNYIYPCKVKVYKRIKDDQWSFIQEVKVGSFPEMSDLKFRTIYGL